jgi:dihydrofolate reductase
MDEKYFSIIAALDAESGIAKDNAIPWHLDGDLAHFQTITTKTQDRFKSNAVIMGRATWESLPPGKRPLPGRVNIVLTHNDAADLPASVVKADHWEKVFQYIQGHADEIENVFVIGGGRVYQDAIQRPECRYLYLTHIMKRYGCDTFFPPFERSFHLLSSSDYMEEDMTTYHFTVYQRK